MLRRAVRAMKPISPLFGEGRCCPIQNRASKSSGHRSDMKSLFAPICSQTKILTVGGGSELDLEKVTFSDSS